jgi:phenylpropionate dioxygenase-like ring-hydroxylating dioxygenase large terminal subunit
MSDEPSAPSSSGVWDMVIPQSQAEAADHGFDRHPVAPERGVYDLVDRPPAPPVPNGWYAVGTSDELTHDRPIAFIAVERNLVAFRDADGAAHVVAAFCPHMGAHLGDGTMVDGTLRCGYHGWRFGGDGACVDIPYGEGRIPSKACVRSYEVREQDGLVLFWFHARGDAPSYEVPTFDEAHDREWSRPHVFRAEMVASLQDMAENNVDYTHFRFVHGRNEKDRSYSEFTTDGPFSTVIEHFDAHDMAFTRFTFGPGVALLRIPQITTVLTTTTPIDRRHVRLLWHFYFPAGAEATADAVIAGVVGDHGLQADLPIWRDKVFVDRPLLVKGDGPILEFRRWYEQFYDGAR